MCKQGTLALLEQLNSDISGDDSIFAIFEDFRVHNVNLQNALSSESSDNVTIVTIPNEPTSFVHYNTEKKIPLRPGVKW